MSENNDFLHLKQDMAAATLLLLIGDKPKYDIKYSNCLPSTGSLYENVIHCDEDTKYLLTSINQIILNTNCELSDLLYEYIQKLYDDIKVNVKNGVFLSTSFTTFELASYVLSILKEKRFLNDFPEVIGNFERACLKIWSA